MHRHAIIVGLGFGDEGKGTTVEWACRTTYARLVCRFNGGAQASHAVVLDDGREHRFAQFGSGTFAGIRTFLSRHVLVNPVTMMNEERVLREKFIGPENPLAWMHVDRDALATTPFHMMANRLRELARGGERHGSCGMGIGETVEDALARQEESIYIRDAADSQLLRKKLRWMQEYKAEQMRVICPEGSCDGFWAWANLLDSNTVERTASAFRRLYNEAHVVDGRWLDGELKAGPVVFEGAQGVLLDQDYGFHPHTTWSKTTAANAIELLGGRDEARIIGVTRTFSTRHGAGPFVTESSTCQPLVDRDHNRTGLWQGNFRAGHLDLVALRYAAEIVKPDEIAVTHMDVMKQYRPEVCRAYCVISGDRALFHAHSADAEQASHITAIILYQQPDLARQAKVTETLFGATPVMEKYQTAEHALAQISMACGSPVSVQSWGPTFQDKVAAR